MPLTTEQRDRTTREVRDAVVQAGASAALTAAPRVVPIVRDRVQTFRANQAERAVERASSTVTQSRQLSPEQLRQQAFDQTERQAAENYRRYQESGGFNGQLQRELAEAEARNARQAQVAAEQAAQNAVNADRARQAQLLEEARRASFNEQLEALSRDWKNNPQKYQNEITAAQKEVSDLLKNAAQNQASRRAADIDNQLAQQARELRQLELNETYRVRRAQQELADSIARNARRASENAAADLLRNGSYVNEFNRLQQQQLTRMTAKALNYPVDAIEAAELAKLRRPTNLLPDTRPPINSEALRSRASKFGNGIEGLGGREPFTNRPKPDFPTKPPIQEKIAKLPDTFHPIEFKTPKAKFNPFDLRPIPADLQNGMLNKTKSLLPHRPLPQNLSPDLPRPILPWRPRTNFPIRLPKISPLDIALDLGLDLLFPDPLNEGEDEMLKNIARQRENQIIKPYEYQTESGTFYRALIAVHNARTVAEKVVYPNDKPSSFAPEWVYAWTSPTSLIAGKILGTRKLNFTTVTLRNGNLTADYSGYTEHQIINDKGQTYSIAAASTAQFDIAYIAALVPQGTSVPSVDPGNGELPLPDDGIDPKLDLPGYPLDFRPVPGNPRKPDWRPKPKPGQTPVPFKPWGDPSRPTSIKPDPDFNPDGIPSPENKPRPLPPFQEFRRPIKYPGWYKEYRYQNEEENCTEEDCMTCRFNLAAIRSVVQEEINKQLESKTTVEVYDDDTGKIEQKPASILSLGTTSDAVKMIYSEIAKVRQQKPVATVPDRFKTRVPDDRPQMVIVYADSKNKSYYQLVVPWARNAKPPASKWKKGSKMVILELKDNSKIVVNAINESEGNRVINQLKSSIPSDKLTGSKVTVSCRKDKLKEIDVTPIRADWYEKGLAQDTPTKRYYYA